MPTPAKVEDWQAPWEKKGEEVDADKVKAFTHSLLIREEKAIAEAAAVKQQAEALETEKQTLQGKLDQATAAGGEQAQQLQARVTELEGQITAAKADGEKSTARQKLLLEVATDRGLSWRQVAKLEGDTLEALQADADETFGKPEVEDDDGVSVRPKPKTLHNHGDPDGSGKGWDRDAALAQIPRM